MHACLGQYSEPQRPLITPRGRDFLCYLAGPISGLSYDNGQTWRDYVSSNLPVEIRGVSPLRAKQELRKVGVINQSYEFNPLMTDSGITARDRFDVMRADAVFFNFLGATEKSIGTCIELGQADILRKPMILVMEDEGNVHEHPIVRDVCGWRTNSLDHGIKLLEQILLPEGVGTPREL